MRATFEIWLDHPAAPKILAAVAEIAASMPKVNVIVEPPIAPVDAAPPAPAAESAPKKTRTKKAEPEKVPDSTDPAQTTALEEPKAPAPAPAPVKAPEPEPAKPAAPAVKVPGEAELRDLIAEYTKAKGLAAYKEKLAAAGVKKTSELTGADLVAFVEARRMELVA